MQPSTRRGRELAPLVSSTATGGGGATRVTSDATSAVGTGIAANIDAAVAAVSTADLRGTTPGREGFAATTLFPPPLIAMRCRVSLQTSRMGVGAMLNPVITRSLTKSAGKSYTQKNSIAKETKKNILGGKRHDSEGKTRRRRAYRTRTTPRVRPTPPHFSRGGSRPNRLLPGLWVTATLGMGLPD